MVKDVIRSIRDWLDNRTQRNPENCISYTADASNMADDLYGCFSNLSDIVDAAGYATHTVRVFDIEISHFKLDDYASAAVIDATRGAPMIKPIIIDYINNKLEQDYANEI